MKRPHPQFHRWILARRLILGLFASAVSALVLCSGCTFMSQQANRKKFNTFFESGQYAYAADARDEYNRTLKRLGRALVGFAKLIA